MTQAAMCTALTMTTATGWFMGTPLSFGTMRCPPTPIPAGSASPSWEAQCSSATPRTTRTSSATYPKCRCLPSAGLPVSSQACTPTTGARYTSIISSRCRRWAALHGRRTLCRSCLPFPVTYRRASTSAI